MEKMLFLFPFAGGNSYSLGFYKKYLTDKSYYIEYPGRGKKSGLPLVYNIDELVNIIYEDIFKNLNVSYSLYGHSMGALVGYLLLKKLQNENHLLPTHFFVSSRNAPSNITNELLHNLPSNFFWEKVKELGGSPDEVFESQILKNFFEPILRADFQAIETYQYEPTQPFDIPITIMLGKDDKVTYEEAMLWQKETTYPIDIRYFDGGHFFIFDHAKEIADLMNEKISNVNV